MRRSFTNQRRCGLPFLCALVLLVVILYGSGFLRKGVLRPENAPIWTAQEVAEQERARNPILDLSKAPEIWVDADYAHNAGAPWYPKGESPILAALVKKGELPPVAERTGTEPVVYQSVDGKGGYGGDWWRVAGDIDGVRLALQYELNNSTLVRFSPYGEPIRPHLAKSVTAADDYKTWTITLRRGVRWSDGALFTAEDLVWWWREVKNDPALGSIDETMRSGGLPGEMEKIDEYAIRIRFPIANPGWLAQQASAAGALYMAGPKHYMIQFHPRLGMREMIEKKTHDLAMTPRQLFWRMNNPLNPDRPKLSPWILKTFSSNGPWTAVRNPYYYAVDTAGNQLPYIDRIVFRQVSEKLQAKAFTDGTVSSQYLNTTDQDYATLMDNRQTGNYAIRHWYQLCRSRLAIIPSRRPPESAAEPAENAKRELLNNPEFRRALSLLIDRKAIIHAEHGGSGEPANIGPGPGDLGYDPDFLRENVGFEPSRAAGILDRLGLEKRDADGTRLYKGMRLYFNLICHQGTTGTLQFVIEDWAKAGIRTVLQEKPHRLFIEEMKRADLYSSYPGNANTWLALGAGTPYWDWYFNGGLYHPDNPELANNPNIAAPNALEIKAIRHGLAAGTLPGQAERLRELREVLRIAREQVWNIPVSPAGPGIFLVKNGLRGVPQSMKADFSLNTPANAYPETWHWENPQAINGDTPADEQYLAERNSAITEELRNSVQSPDFHPEQTVAAKQSGGFWWSAIKILLTVSALALFVMAALRRPFILRRLIIMVPTLLIISVIVFSAVRLPPGNYLDTVISNLERQGLREQAQTEIAQMNEMYHLDEGAVKSYCRWIGFLWFTSFSPNDTGILQGDLGRSMSNNGTRVTDLLGDRLLLTITISFFTILLTWLVAIPIGVYSAVRQYSLADYSLTIGGVLGMCIPQFILALLLMLLAKAVFGITITGLFSPQYALQNFWDWNKILDLMKHIWVPVIVVGVGGTAGMIRILRANLLDELRKPYVTTARAKGLPPLRLLVKYPFRLSLIPFIAGIGGLFPALVSGSAIVEIVLSLPTTGPLLLNAVMLEDTYMASSLLLCLSALSVFGVIVSDLLLMVADPRIRLTGGTR